MERMRVIAAVLINCEFAIIRNATYFSAGVACLGSGGRWRPSRHLECDHGGLFKHEIDQAIIRSPAL